MQLQAAEKAAEPPSGNPCFSQKGSPSRIELILTSFFGFVSFHVEAYKEVKKLRKI